MDLEGLSGLQQTALQHCQDKIAGLEETIAQLVMLVKKLEKMVCWCHNQLLSPGPHYVLGKEEEMVEETEEEDEEEEDSGLRAAKGGSVVGLSSVEREGPAGGRYPQVYDQLLDG